MIKPVVTRHERTPVDEHGSPARRKNDQLGNTIIAVVLIIGATVLAYQDKLTAEGLLAAYTLAAAVGGVPIVVRRSNGHD